MKQIAWINGYTIQIISALAALLHDLGKSSVGFQEKLKPNSIFYADQYRHEWISVRLFEAMIQGCDTDESSDYYFSSFRHCAFYPCCVFPLRNGKGRG